MIDDARCPGPMALPAVSADAQDPRAADVAVETARIVAVIPALDEALAIAEVVRCARALRHPLRPEPLFAEVIVVDNGSHDDTGARAVAAGAKVVREPERGYGAACLAGIRAAAPSTEVFVFVDGDGSVALEQTRALLAPLWAGADLVIGVRRAVDRGAMSLPQRFGNRLACTLIRRLWHARVSDLGPFRAIRRGALEQLGMRDRRFGWTVEMQVRAIQCRLRCVEVPVRCRVRRGRSKISGTLRGVLLAAHGILGTIGALWLAERRSRRAPNRARTVSASTFFRPPGASP